MRDNPRGAKAPRIGRAFHLTHLHCVHQVLSRASVVSQHIPIDPESFQGRANLLRWSKEQSKLRIPNARVLFALGLGAGLSAIEIAGVCASHVSIANGEGVVAVSGERPRQLSLSSPWAALLRTGLTSRKPDDWAFCPIRKGAGTNLVSNFVARAPSIEIKPNTQRMRATWIVERLSTGHPAIELMRDAGVQSLEALTRYVQFVS